MKNKISLLIDEIVMISLYLFTYFITLFLKKKELWIISERGSEARDNGLWLFLYMINNHPEKDVRYVISKDSNDFYKLRCNCNKIIRYRSFMHYFYINKASHLISTHIMGFTPNPYFFNKLNKAFNIFSGKKLVFLQHGIIKDNLPTLFGSQVKLDLFCCGAQKEYEYVNKTFGHPQNVVKYTGLCRYDGLNSFQVKNQILVMPTWRNGIDLDKIEESIYFKKWIEFLKSESLHEILVEKNIELVFYPHYNMQRYIKNFRNKINSNNIIIAGFEYDVQTLLKESKMLITDYSSVYFDMAYMNKPILLYQFDYKFYRENHYSEGYFNAEYIGEKCETLDALLKCLQYVIDADFKNKEIYSQYVSTFFTKRDSYNCERVYKSINAL